MALNVVSWRVAADNKLEIVGLENTLDLTHPADATVVVTVRNKKTGAIITGLNAVTAAYVAGTSGPLVLDAAGNYVSGVMYRTLAATAAVTPPIGLYKAEALATRSGVTGREFCIITVEED